MLKMNNPIHTRRIAVSLWAVAAVAAFGAPQSHAGFFDGLTTSKNYTVLYEGLGGNTLHVTNVTVDGNIGVGNTGKVSDSGPSTVNGRLDFSAGNTGQFTGAPGDVGPTSVNYSVAAVTSALSEVNSLSSTLGGEAHTDVAISGNQTIDINTGTLDANGNYVFNITSYSENDGNVLTLVGDPGGHSVVFNWAAGGNPQFKGDVALTGLTSDQVLWNYTGTNNVSLNTNASSFPNLAFRGDILAPNASLSSVNANLAGRLWGGDTSDMQIVSGSHIFSQVPEPSSVVLLLTAMLAGWGAFRSRPTSSAGCGSRA
jgi:choice-of-anchor A domain-containing protein